MKVSHPFASYPDGRRSGCVRCRWPRSAHPDLPAETHPDPDYEAEIVRAAASGLADAESLISMARERSHAGPLRDFLTRDFDQDFLEEMADGGGNYAVWANRKDADLVELGRLDEETARQKAHLRIQAIGYVVLAFSLVEQAREL